MGKVIFMLLASLLLISCDAEEEKYNKLKWKIRREELIIDHIHRLRSIKADLNYKETIRHLDSLELEYKKLLRENFRQDSI